jgi:DNA-binding transcriptional regulator YhcF (GntR family)
MPVQINVIGSEEYVRKYCTEMNIKTEYMNQAIKIAQNIDKLNIITEHTQFSIAATSVLIMAELNSITNMTKKSLKTMFGVSNVTISKAYKKLEQLKHILIDDEKVNKLVEKLNKLNEQTQLSDDIKKRMDKFNINYDKNPSGELNTDIKNIKDTDNIKIICKPSSKPIKKIKDKTIDKKL